MNGVGKFSEKHGRSILKAISFRGVIILIDAITIYLITQKMTVTLHIITVSTLVHTLAYYLHERWWNRIHWGKHQHYNH